MDKASIISFIRIVQTYPKLLENRKEMNKAVNRLGDAAYKEQRKMLFDYVERQKVEIMQCYDKYREIVGGELMDAFLNGEEGKDKLVDKLLEAFFTKEGGEDGENRS